jgi:competence protein ComEA
LFIQSTYRLFVIFATLCLAIGCGRVATGGNRSSDLVAPENADSVNINTATEEELQKIPRIGPKLAKDIVEFRSQYGPFRRPEQLMLIQGISDRRFREIRNYIRVE